MAASKHAQPDGAKAQLEKFRDLARELECDDDEEAFKAKLRQIAKAPPQHRPKDDDEP